MVSSQEQGSKSEYRFVNPIVLLLCDVMTAPPVSVEFTLVSSQGQGSKSEYRFVNPTVVIAV